jgi:hypothetical protein
MPNESTPEHVDETPTVPVAPLTNRELMYGRDDRFADDAEFKETLRWDRER